MGCRWKRLLKPFENFVKKKFDLTRPPGTRPRGPQDLTLTSPKPTFFQFKPNIANGVSTEASAQAC